MSSFNFDSLVDALNKSGSDDDEELSSLDFKSLKKDTKKKRPNGQKSGKKSIVRSRFQHFKSPTPKKGGKKVDMTEQKKCCKCRYVKVKGKLYKVKGSYSHCSYEMDNCCKDKKTIVKQKKKKKRKRKKKKSKRKTTRR